MVHGNGDLNLFVVEDNKLVRLAVTKLIDRIGDFNIIGFADDGRAAVQEILEKKPQIALVDIGLPSLDGIEVTRQIKAAIPNLKVIMLTASDSDRHVVEALDAGADGYVLKEVFGDRLEMAIRSVRIGAVWLDPAIAKRLLVLAREAPGEKMQQVGVATLSAEDVSLLGAVAESGCADGMCLVEPEFLKKLHDKLADD